jgi:hypothetical protein
MTRKRVLPGPKPTLRIPGHVIKLVNGRWVYQPIPMPDTSRIAESAARFGDGWLASRKAEDGLRWGDG